ncbi:MAG: type II toxin-antitoxin system RelE/ParE family toxin [Betaproteobacteria bacterium]|nr:type II toxin-antitoxin system RelE/ParE family toxin [Betaproteobacteria bacterium]NCP81125.1 type II toxin-antitoxin system RelE/ParE family toxin [Rhodoferax sp.]NCS61852.1 type II toxin-antitoxin system RelE/ParE family toxin [Rhodoferax sp.]OIP14715.1 MAG: addiction module toxin RelE [Comamonadaceae bacterium CG2_30_57_122]PJC23068.1 MAG: type II toxin-antitoxin system mRNA interferase toxin, RelE/StbE family [Comamonadaceae bacterium CG_4_9_14_0_8_um_filter_57_21]
MPTYKLRFHALALKEWQQLDASVREPFKKKLAERLQAPHIPSAALHGLADCYKIKLHSVGYRLVYRVDESEIFVIVIAAGRRDKSKVYQAAVQRVL